MNGVQKLSISDRQTRIRNGFSLIIDDSGHIKSGNFTDGVGRQYIGEIGKTENGIVVVTTHLYDGVRSLPLDLELYQHANSLPEGKKDKDFVKKPDLALKLVEKTLLRKLQPGIVLIDGGYGNNSRFLKEIEKLKLIYIGGLAKNRQASVINEESKTEAPEKRLDEIAFSLTRDDFKAVILELEKPKKVQVTTRKVKLRGLEGERTVAIVMNASSPEDATEIDYLVTNKLGNEVTAEWFVKTFSKRNYIEQFYREAKGWLGLKEYQVRKKDRCYRHFILVFTAYTFIIYQKLMGGLRKRYANKPLTTFTETLEAFLTGVSYRFFCWLRNNIEFFAAHKSTRGYVWG